LKFQKKSQNGRNTIIKSYGRLKGWAGARPLLNTPLLSRTERTDAWTHGRTCFSIFCKTPRSTLLFSDLS